MANYEDASQVVGELEAIANGTSSNAGMSADVAAAIIAALGGATAAAAATEIATAPITSDNVGDITAEGIIANDGVTIDANFNDTPVVAVVTGSGTDNNKIDMSAKTDDVAVVLSGGTGDSVQTGSGDDTIEFRDGEATIHTGDGNDTVVMSGDTGAFAQVHGGAGNGLFQFVAGFLGQASIMAGDGFDRVSFHGGKDQFRFTAPQGGKFSMFRDGPGRAEQGQVDMQDVNVVTFDPENDGIINDATVLATTRAESLVAKLYNVALGRDVVDSTASTVDGQPVWIDPSITNPTAADYQMSGINWWLDQAGSHSEIELAQMFVGTKEFQDKIAGMTSTQIVQTMFDNINATSVDGQTVANFAAQLESGTNIAQVAMDIAMSAEATEVLGLNGDQYVIDGF